MYHTLKFIFLRRKPIMGIFRKKNKAPTHTVAEREAEKYNHRQEKYDDELRKVEQKTTFKTKLSRLKFPTYTKNLVAIIILICLIDLQITYILAFMDKVQIAEELSKQLCTTILGVAFVYMVRAYFDSKAEHNNNKETVDDNKIKKELDTLVNSKLSSVIQDFADNVGVEFPLNEILNSTTGSLDDEVPVNDEIPDEEEPNVNIISAEIDADSMDVSKPINDSIEEKSDNTNETN
jgi:putative alpha-1,2-mannosidase